VQDYFFIQIERSTQSRHSEFCSININIIKEIWKNIISEAEDKEEQKDEVETAIAQIRRHQEQMDQQIKDMR
jgi:hypothetical protein